MSWVSSFFSPGKGYEAAQEQLDKYYKEAQDALRPWQTHGQDQYQILNNYIQSLMNPEKLHNEWISGYEESPSAIDARDIATQHGLNAASSMGLLGSNTALNALQKGASQISLNDRENYLANLMQKYLQGAGLSQGIYGTGANIAANMGTNAMNMGNSSAEMAYGRQNAGSNLLQKLMSNAVGAAATAMGGPAGASMASKWSLS